MKWIMAANGKKYDHASAFQEWGYIDWKQGVNFEIGDIVYIYCTSPIKKLMYKTEVIKNNMNFSECQDDKKYWTDIEEYEKSKTKKFARIKLLAQVDTEMLTLEKLRNNGLKTPPQGPIKISEELSEYVDKYFNDYTVEGYYEDLSSKEQIFEGHKLTVQVNKYERSSVARGKAIQYHGCTCYVCGINFENVYGEVGKGFIHIHHKVPLHTIDSEYCVDYENDLIPVCPNCHAMLHRKENGKYLTIEQLKNRFNKI